MLLLHFMLSVFLVHLVHELGHAYFAKLFGAKVNEISIGTGPAMIHIKKLTFRLGLLLGGYCYWEEKHNLSVVRISIIHLGGIIFNLISASFILMLMSTFQFPGYKDFLMFVLYSYALVILNGIPYRFGLIKSDGWQVIEIFVYWVKTCLKKR
ncbi:site-2 protease family protein [Chengkuizengella axinellae]|uniref:Site-2 protease family protein n=1 Tax=Chengkuizengella axinellae TaxID=3064388 RepID=A0ABT9IXR1_9BACL|nr:site-2 protease family protein [Chengkuizengella sp. 2205SS18-9]MDP5274150.1 site-2 protease family protein [Chengkuizengella sp. 2205SS18-9]